MLQRTANYQPWLFYYCLFALFWVTLLLFAGGFTTTIRAGMAFLDWPLSNGSINPEGWITETDQLAEHGHRLLGMKVGLISIGLWLWTWFRQERKSVRVLAQVLLLMVVLQGLMGGARVRFDWLNTQAESNFVAQTFAVSHACGAMLVLGLFVAITVLCSRRWLESSRQSVEPIPSSIRYLGIAACVGIFFQVLIGAIMRHAEAGLAIARFPLSSANSLLPAYWDFAVGINFAHRVGAVLLTVLLLVFLYKCWSHRIARKALFYGLFLLLALLFIQIYLGALTVWTVRNSYVATFHHLTGAFLLATTCALTFLSFAPARGNAGLSVESEPTS
ncbi:MAG: COX15/CtaA family protein [Coraliomargaritaceae bacterium]